MKGATDHDTAKRVIQCLRTFFPFSVEHLLEWRMLVRSPIASIMLMIEVEALQQPAAALTLAAEFQRSVADDVHQPGLE